MKYLRAFDVILLSETRAAYIPDELFPQHSIALCTASRHGRAGEGIAFIVRKQYAYHVQDWSSDDTSLWVKLTFQSRQRPLIIGACYVPPAASLSLGEVGAADRFAILAAKLTAAQIEGDVLIGGDFNARVGDLLEAACAQQRGPMDVIINSHGRHFIDMSATTTSLLCTGRSPGDESAAFSYKASHRSPGSRLDHVVVSRDLFPCITWCMINAARPESDHHPIECSITLDCQHKLLERCQGKPLFRCQWQPDLRDAYSDALLSAPCGQLLQQTQAAAAGGDVLIAFTHLHHATGQAADMCGMAGRHARPNGLRPANKAFFDKECMSLKRQVHRATGDTRRDLERRYHSPVCAKRRAHLLGRLKVLISEQYSHPRRFWKQLRESHAALPVCLQAVQVWDDYQAQVADVGCPATCLFMEEAYPQRPIGAAATLNMPITTGEVEHGLARLHNERAKGSQGFSSEFLRHAKHQPERGEAPPQHVLLPAVTAALQAAFRAGQVPKEYNGGLITPVFNQGASLDTSNYRPIAVTEPLMHLYAGILNARLLAYTEAQGLRAETQTGFRPGYSKVHQLFALQNCIDKTKRAKKPFFACKWTSRALMIGCSAPCCGRYCSALKFVVRCWQPSKAFTKIVSSR